MDLNKLIIFAKSNGFVFKSSEIYGGFSGVYDYGPLGVELNNNIKKEWWKTIVQNRGDIVGLDTGIMMNPDIWKASGHIDGFSDPFVECTKTGKRFRADHLLEEIGVDADERMNKEEFIKIFEKNRDLLKPEGCDPKDLSTPDFQNLLVNTNFGTANENKKVYLRGETCQGIYVNFKNVLDSMRMKLPFGIAQIGKAFRNEISPRQFLFRTREFEQMEMQYFVNKKDAKETFKKWLDIRFKALQALGLPKDKLRITEHKRLIFYASAASDIEYEYSFGWKELEGIHNRGDYDLTQHSKCSGENLTYFDEANGEHIVPHIIETSIGVGRLFLAILESVYKEEKLTDGTTRIVLKFNSSMAPMKVAVFPLQKKDGISEKAKEIYNSISSNLVGYYDETGSIGKRYRRADEIGTLFAITIDYDTLEDSTVTVRDRDTMKQDRVKINKLVEYINSRII